MSVKKIRNNINTKRNHNLSRRISNQKHWNINIQISHVLRVITRVDLYKNERHGRISTDFIASYQMWLGEVSTAREAYHSFYLGWKAWTYSRQ